MGVSDGLSEESVTQESVIQDYLDLPEGGRVFFKRVVFPPTPRPEWLFLGGYGSDIGGVKASFLFDLARKTKTTCTLFDYEGCGNSSGVFTQMTFGHWLANGLAVLDHLTQGPQILIGSSMGGWIMLCLARKRPDRIARLIGVAAAPDWTEELFYQKLSPPLQKTLEETGTAQLIRPHVSRYSGRVPSDPLELTWKSVLEGRKHLIFPTPFSVPCPLVLLHGTQDEVVPWTVSQRLLDHVQAPFSSFTLIKNGNHRLHRPEDLNILAQFLGE